MYHILFIHSSVSGHLGCFHVLTVVVGWHHWLNGHEFEQAPGVGDEQGSLACCSPQDHKELDMIEQLNWTEIVLLWTLCACISSNYSFLHIHGLPRRFSGKESAGQGRRRRRHRFSAWVRKASWRRKWQPIPVFLLGKYHGQRSLVGYSP